MPTQEHPDSATVAFLLEQILEDVHGDDEQLRALHAAITSAFVLPLDVHVVGQPLSLVAVDYHGHPRRGLTALCRHEDGTEYRVAFADVRLLPAAIGRRLFAAYCAWLDIEPRAIEPTSSAPAKLRKHKASGDDIDLSKPVELVVLAVKQRAARCRLVGSERVITLRAGSLHRVVSGQIAVVQPNRQWGHAGHPYLSGKIISARIDAGALGLVPLALRAFGEWDPAREYWGEPDDDDIVPIDEWAKPIIARGPRPMFEMEQVLPGRDTDDFESDPILEASDLRQAGDTAGARAILAKLLEADLRCLDAHAHLGNMLFRSSPEWALQHYEVGARIGELSLVEGFDGVLAWGLLDNRPLLRCMHGQGLCLWRLERWEEAERLLERMLWLNPTDNQGIRSLLPEVRAREAWVDDED